MDINDLDNIILKIKMACTEGKFIYKGRKYDFSQYIPYFNPECKIYPYHEVKDIQDALILAERHKHQ